MFKTLLTFAVVLSIASIAYAIDDFDKYVDQAAVDVAWVDISVNDQGGPVTGASADVDLLIGNWPTVYEGGAAGDFEFTLTGGWDYPNAKPPGDPGYVKAEWEATSDKARIELTLLNKINIAAAPANLWSLTFWIKPLTNNLADLGDLNVYGYGKNAAEEDVYARCIIPCPLDSSFQWWYPASWIPAALGDLSQFGWSGDERYASLPHYGVGEWGLIVINSEQELNYAWGNVPFHDIVSLESIVVEINSDTDMTNMIDMRETEGDDKYPIKGGVYGFAIDGSFSFYAVPEPTTIALLGLGSLSLLRRKH